MSRTRVKICGITRLADAESAIEAGADALGFVFVKASKRYIEPKQAQQIINQLPGLISTVALVMDATTDEIKSINDNVQFSSWQFHGVETAEICDEISSTSSKRYIKAIPVGGLSSAEIKQRFVDYPTASSLLVDGHAAGKLGGSGEKANLDLLRKTIPKSDISKLILAGGLSPDNIYSALAKIQPYAIDLSSSVEDAPGIKSPAKIRALFEQVRLFDAQRAAG